MKKILFLASIVTLAFASCEKDKDCDRTMEKIAGSYGFEAAVYKLNSSTPDQNWLQTMMDACERDDIQVFNANGTYTYQDAGSQCGGDFTSTWSLNGNTMTIDGEPGTIQSFDCKKLVVYSDNVLTAGDRLTVTLVKK